MFLRISTVSNWELEQQSALDDEEPHRLELLIMTVSCFPSVSDEFFKWENKRT